MNIDGELRQELEILSKDIFGSSSRWQTILKKGWNKPVEKIAEKSTRFEKVYYTPETLKIQLLDLKNNRDKAVEDFKNRLDAKEQTHQDLIDASGSAATIDPFVKKP